MACTYARGNSGEWYLFSSLVPRDPGHGTRNAREDSGSFSSFTDVSKLVP